MGTNFVLLCNVCHCCGRSDKLHIGKSSAGWKFLFEKIPKVAENKADWMELTRKGEIVDEYGKKWSFDDFWDLVARKQVDRAQRFDGMYLVDGYNFFELSGWS